MKPIPFEPTELNVWKFITVEELTRVPSTKSLNAESDSVASKTSPPPPSSSDDIPILSESQSQPPKSGEVVIVQYDSEERSEVPIVPPSGASVSAPPSPDEQ